MPDAKELPKYQSHKVVGALKIKSLRTRNGATRLYPAEAGYPPIKLTPEYVEKHRPRAGGYYVVYDGGDYVSFSPAAPFEAGYTRI